MKKAKNLFKILNFIGIIIILGTAGASDLERLNLQNSVSYLLFGGTLLLIGSFGLYILKQIKASASKRIKFKKRKTYQGTLENIA